MRTLHRVTRCGSGTIGRIGTLIILKFLKSMVGSDADNFGQNNTVVPQEGTATS